MSIRVRRGWVQEVNGIAVHKSPAKHHGSGWPQGRPRGLVFHYTAGCGSDISGTLDARGVSAHFSVDRDGRIYQYVSLRNYAYHAYEASLYYYGIEHTALRGTCDLTDRQLMASARLWAGLVEYERTKGNDIPLRRAPGCPFDRGFKEHADGLEPGCTWNPNRHTDGLYRWTWDEFIAAIGGSVPVVYLYKRQRFASLSRLISKLRDDLQHATPGETHSVRVMRK